MEDQVKKLKRLARAQTRFKNKQRRAGSVRIDVHISNIAYERLISSCAANSCSQGECLDRLLTEEIQQGRGHSVAKSVTYSKPEADLEALTRQELIDFARRQQFWLEKLRDINDVLMANS